MITKIGKAALQPYVHDNDAAFAYRVSRPDIYGDLVRYGAPQKEFYDAVRQDMELDDEFGSAVDATNRQIAADNVKSLGVDPKVLRTPKLVDTMVSGKDISDVQPYDPSIRGAKIMGSIMAPIGAFAGYKVGRGGAAKAGLSGLRSVTKGLKGAGVGAFAAGIPMAAAEYYAEKKDWAPVNAELAKLKAVYPNK